ncbi:MAG: hypothetical protein K1000chlam2_00028 [Chlamydiae bacterium]|nr:hypothetical protein [Chlamydiota bacterium]
MLYSVKFTFLDTHEVEIKIDKESLTNFFTCLKEKNVYWNDEDGTVGFWLDLDKVRYVQCFAERRIESDSDPKEDQDEFDDNDEEAKI